MLESGSHRQNRLAEPLLFISGLLLSFAAATPQAVQRAVDGVRLI